MTIHNDLMNENYIKLVLVIKIFNVSSTNAQNIKDFCIHNEMKLNWFTVTMQFILLNIKHN